MIAAPVLLVVVKLPERLIAFVPPPPLIVIVPLPELMVEADPCVTPPALVRLTLLAPLVDIFPLIVNRPLVLVVIVTEFVIVPAVIGPLTVKAALVLLTVKLPPRITAPRVEMVFALPKLMLLPVLAVKALE